MKKAKRITGLPETMPVSMKNNSGQILYQLPQINVDDNDLMVATGQDTAKLILKECFNNYEICKGIMSIDIDGTLINNQCQILLDVKFAVQ